MAVPYLLTELLEHLVDQTLVRRPNGKPVGDQPRVYIEPRDGVPAPTAADGDGSVIGMFHAGGVRSKPRESLLRQDVIEFRVRSLLVPRTEDVYRQISGELIDRQAWMVGAREVLDCQEWRALQRLGSDADGFSHLFAVWFQTRA